MRGLLSPSRDGETTHVRGIVDSSDDSGRFSRGIGVAHELLRLGRGGTNVGRASVASECLVHARVCPPRHSEDLQTSAGTSFRSRVMKPPAVLLKTAWG